MVNLYDALVEVKCRLLDVEPAEAVSHFIDRVLMEYQEERRETVPEIAHALLHWRNLTPGEVDTLGGRLMKAWLWEREAHQKAFESFHRAMLDLPGRLPDLKELETQVAGAKEGA